MEEITAMDKEFLKYVFISVVLFFVIFYGAMILSAKPVPEDTDLLTYTFKEHTNLELHIHPELEIVILGQKRTIPADIGITEEGMRVIHTHDDTGRIHIESPWAQQFYLKDFFFIWGRKFDGNCIFEYCSNGTHVMEVFVNGTRSELYGDVPLHDLERIRIVYRER